MVSSSPPTTSDTTWVKEQDVKQEKICLFWLKGAFFFLAEQLLATSEAICPEELKAERLESYSP